MHISIKLSHFLSALIWACWSCCCCGMSGSRGRERATVQAGLEAVHVPLCVPLEADSKLFWAPVAKWCRMYLEDHFELLWALVAWLLPRRTL